MDHIGRRQSQLYRSRGAQIAHRHVNFVSRGDVVFRIMQFPPKTVTNDSYLKRIAGELGVLDLTDRACGSERQHHHDQDWRYSPGKLYGSTAVHLWRFGIVLVGRSSPVTHHSAKEQSTDNYEDCPTNHHPQYPGPNHPLCPVAHKLTYGLDHTHPSD